MMWKLVFSLMLVGMAGAPTVSFGTDSAKLFDFMVENYPVEPGACEQAAQSIARELSRATGLSVYKSECMNRRYLSATLRIWYSAPVAAAFVATEPWMTRESRVGYYTTYDECAADLSRQIDVFRRETSLSPFLAYCSRDNYGNRPYVPRITAVGKPTKVPFTSAHVLFGQPLESEASILAQVRTGLGDRGIKLTQASVAATGPLDTAPLFYLQFQYYAKATRNDALWLKRIPGTHSQICARQKEEMRGMLKEAGIAPVASFCIFDRSLHRTNLELLLDGRRGMFARRRVPGRYASFAQCDADRDRVFRSSHGSSDFGAICLADGAWTTVYQAWLLKKCGPMDINCALSGEESLLSVEN